MTVTPSDLDNIAGYVEGRLGNLHTCMPAEVLKVHDGVHKRQFVDVLPTLQRRVFDEDGNELDESYPLVYMVPVGYPQGGGFFVSVPLAVGDIVLLVFAERSLDAWLQTATKGSQRQIIPGDPGLHVLEGAVAFPVGPAPRPALLQDIHATNLVIGRDGGGAQIHITPGGEVLLGSGNATDAVALASKVHAAIDAMLQSGIGVTGTEAFAAARAAWQTGTAGGPVPDPAPPAVPAPVGATKVKGE